MGTNKIQEFKLMQKLLQTERELIHVSKFKLFLP